MLPTLYKFKNGKFLMWRIEVEGPGNKIVFPRYVISHGYDGGAIQTTYTEIKQGKNIGRANETSAMEQCLLEAKSLWTKQVERKGYSEEKIETECEVPKPMLAHSYDEYSHKVVYPCVVQPKLDGIRCLVVAYPDSLTFYSRQGKEFPVLDHIKDDLFASLLRDSDDRIVLDGELYHHELDFQSIISGVKRDEANDLTKHIQYHIYDLHNTTLSYAERQKVLRDMWFTNCKYVPNNSLRLVPSLEVHTIEEIEAKHAEFTASAYEGAMIRNLHGMYKPDGRSFDLLKFKKFRTEEFEIIGAEENKGKARGQCSLICKTSDGTTFKVKPEGTEEIRKQYWKDWTEGKLEGRLLTVRFFSWTDSEKPVPRFPIGIAVRDYE